MAAWVSRSEWARHLNRFYVESRYHYAPTKNIQHAIGGSHRGIPLLVLHVLSFARKNEPRISVNLSGDARKTDRTTPSPKNSILDVMKLNANGEADIAPLFAG